MDQHLYSYSAIVERAPLQWPHGARVAFYLAVNIEHFAIDRPAVSLTDSTTQLTPDPLNFGWREYGARVGIWRLVEALDRLGVIPSVMLNSDVCARYPAIIEAGRSRGWCWVAHGKSNSSFHTGMEPEAERRELEEIRDTISAATGVQPSGWLGPALTETFSTPGLLRELGFTYSLDWCNDDQPYELSVQGMIAVPYAIELNDLTLFVGRNLSGPEFVRMVQDQLDQLLADSKISGRVMALPVHPFIVGQPFRHRYLVEALEYVCSREDVWVTTSDAIADHFLTTRASD